MEPRGLPAVQVLPLMSSVYRGRNDADRVEEVVSGPRLTLRFYRISTDRSLVIARCSPGHHTGISQMRRLRLRHPAFPRDSVANPLELTFPSLSAVCKTAVGEGSGRSGSFRGSVASLHCRG